jgi:DNA repair photolyase
MSCTRQQPERYLLRMSDAGESVKGRGAAGRPPNRFLRSHYAIVHAEAIDEPRDNAPPTRYLDDAPRTIVNKVISPDLPFVYSLNPYQGCEHGCAYCYARPTHEYWGYSCGIDFEQVIIVKRNAAKVLEKQLRSPAWKVAPISISGATDPYQPIERKERNTRSVLEVAMRFKQPVSVITKNALVLRDADLLQELAAQGLAAVAISINTLDEPLRRRLEPRTSSAATRLACIRQLAECGIPVMAMVAPIIPALNDHEVPAILKAAAQAGARTAGFTVLRTNGPVEGLFSEWLQAHYPDRAARVMALTRTLHGGRMSDSRAGIRMKGEGAYAQHLHRLFDLNRKRWFKQQGWPELRTDLFCIPPSGQLALFR